ncbi:MAG: 4-hydroxythreonine-4-phosphate dehydrogenase PdxA, partial [Casimicrobiaceae bacterium]
MKPIAVTLGDPAGVGPEIVARVVAESGDCLHGRRLRIYGPASVFERALSACGQPLSAVDRVDTGIDGPWHPGQPSAAGGRAALSAIEAATAACLRGDCAALVTAPISKTALRM